MKKNYKYLSFDLSGTGTTALFDGIKLKKFKSKDFKKHVDFITKEIDKFSKNNKNTIILFETLTKIRRNNNANKDMLDLAKIVGYLEIKYENIFKVRSFMTKTFQKWIKENKKSIDNLEYKQNKGWYFKNKKITDHEVDAMIIYYYGKSKHSGEYW